MRVLITGITGFVGSHKFALATGAEVFDSIDYWRQRIPTAPR